MKFEKLKSQKMSVAVADQIIKLIKNNSIKPGDRLPTETELGESLGVSRTTIREGMQRLQMINIIEIQPGRGTFVRSLPDNNFSKQLNKLGNIENKKTLLEIIEVRKIIEIGIIDIAIQRISDNDLEKLKNCLESHEKGLVKAVFPAKGDIEFHKILANATHNKTLLNIYNDIYKLIIDGVFSSQSYKKDYGKALEFHKEIYNAIKIKDNINAKEAMTRHLDWLENILSKK